MPVVQASLGIRTMWDGVEADMRTKKKKHGRKADHLQAKETCMLMHFIVVSE